MKPYPAYKPTGLAWLPEVPREWEMLRGKFLFTKMERPVRPQDEVVTCFRDGEVTLRKNRRLEGFTESLKEIGYQGVRKGDLVIHVMDAFAGSVGVSDSDGKSTPVYSVCVPKKSGINNYYYAHIVRVMAKTGYIQSLYRGIRERSSDFRFEVFGNQFLPIPPPAEQEAIVAYLDEKTAKIDRLIELKEREIKLLNEKKQAVISKVVTSSLDPNAELVDSGVDWIGKVPRGWKIRRLRYLGGCANGISKDGAAFGRGNPFVSYGDVYKNFAVPTQVTGLVESSESEQILYSVKRGDVFFTRTSETIDELGTAATCLATISKATFAGFLIRFRPNDDSLIPEFSKYYFRSPTVTAYFRRTSGIVTRASLSQNLLKNLSVCIPPQVVQQKIVAYLDAEGAKTDKAIAAMTRQIGLLKEYRTRLISDAVTGRIDLRKL